MGAPSKLYVIRKTDSYVLHKVLCKYQTNFAFYLVRDSRAAMVKMVVYYTRLVYTGLLVELEHPKIKTTLIDEMFESVMGEHVFLKLSVIRKASSSSRARPTLLFSWAETAARRWW
jgi:hypothetical protein